MQKKHISIMPCLDIADGRVVKGIRFEELRDAGDPAESVRAYCRAGADELTMLDIRATVEGRVTLEDTVKEVAAVITIPFTVGGGIRTVVDAECILQAGADKISIGSAAFREPSQVGELVKAFGSECVTVAIDAGPNPALPSGFEVFVDGGRTATGADAVEFAKKVSDLGAGRILPTSKATDGVRTGYDLPLIRALRAATDIELVASGGAGTMRHFLEAAEAGADVLLAASVFHFHQIDIAELKSFLARNGVSIASE